METDSLRFQTDGLRKRNSGHSIPLLVAIAVNTVVFAIMIFFNIAAGQDFGIFKNNTGTISDANEVYITPAGATFATWGVIYTWQGLWVAFQISLIFFKFGNSRLYYEPPVLTIPFQIFIFLNFCANAGWLALWDSQLFTWSWIFSVFMAVTIYIATFIATKNAYDAEVYLNSRRLVVWLYRALVHNGLTFYGTWLTVAALLNLAITITYRWAPSGEIETYKNTSSLISLSIFTVLIAVYFSMEIFFFEKYLRYTFSHYLQLIIAFSGILGKNWSSSGSNPSAVIFTLVLAIIVGVLFIIKICSTVFRALTDRDNSIRYCW